MKLHYMGWLLISCCFFAAGEICSKLVANKFNYSLVIVMCVLSMGSTLTWLPAIIQRNELAVVGTLWSVMSLLITVIIGTCIFNECLCRDKVIGVVLALTSVYLLAK